MPCFMARVLARCHSSAAISASMSENNGGDGGLLVGPWEPNLDA